MAVISAISGLKRQIALENAVDPLEEKLVEGASDAIRDEILDSIEFTLLGAEQDRTLDKIIDKIPEYTEEDPEMIKKIESLTESFVETNL